MVTVIIALTLKIAFFVRSQNVQTNPNTKHNWNFMEISILISAAVYLRKPTLRVVVQGDMSEADSICSEVKVGWYPHVKFQGYVHLISFNIPYDHHPIFNPLSSPAIWFLSGILRPRSTCRGGPSREDDEVATATEGVGWVEGARNDGYHCWGGMYRIITYIYIVHGTYV